MQAGYYRQQSQAFSQLLSIVAYLIRHHGGGSGIRRAECHVFCREHRTVEIATLRVGIWCSAVIVSVFAEALLLAGGRRDRRMRGALVQWACLRQHQRRGAQLSVPLAVDFRLIGLGSLGLRHGMVGAAFPSVQREHLARRCI